MAAMLLIPLHLVPVAATLSVAAAAAPVLTAWADTTATAVSTNAPVLRWPSAIIASGGDGLGPTAIVALRVNVSHAGTPLWSTGEVRSVLLPSWIGLAVYEGPALAAGGSYSWTAEERIVAYSNGTQPTTAGGLFSSPLKVHSGAFTAAASLPSARDEAAAAMSSPNMTALWNGSWHSVNDRIQPSGFLPTSVSGGYGGITQMFVRDASGQIIGLVECGPEHATVAGKALRFMLGQLQRNYQPGSFLSYAPHIMQGNRALTEIVSFDSIDQTDDTFYLIAAYGRYCEATGDTALRADFYELLKNYTMHYFAPGARSFGKTGHNGTATAPFAGGGVLYWNVSLSLLWNPNLEHSRLGSYWSCYDQLTNSFAAEGLRVLAAAATSLGKPEDATLWQKWRARILHGACQSGPQPTSLAGKRRARVACVLLFR